MPNKNFPSISQGELPGYKAPKSKNLNETEVNERFETVGRDSNGRIIEQKNMFSLAKGNDEKNNNALPVDTIIPDSDSEEDLWEDYSQKAESKSYHLSYELGPKNLYDTVAGNAQIIAQKNNDIHLLNLSIELSELIIKYPYNHDMFYKVIVKTKEIEKYIKENLSNEKIKLKSGYAKSKDGGKFKHLSKIDFSIFAGFYEIKLGNYKFDKKIDQVITEDLLTRIKEVALKMFPELDSKTNTTVVASTEFKEKSNAQNTYTNTERGIDKISYSELRRDHENLTDIGRIIVFKFPTSISLDKIENFFETIVELIRVEGNSDILYDESSEKEKEVQTDFTSILEYTKRLIMDEDNEFIMYEINQMLEKLVFDKNITKNNFIEILKLIEDNKTKLQIDDDTKSMYKIMLATKNYFLKLDQKIEDVKAENDFLNFLVAEGFEFSEFKNMFIFRDINIDLEVQKIKNKYPECEIIVDKGSLLIKFPTSKENYSYFILVSFPLFRDIDGSNDFFGYVCYKIGNHELASNIQR